MAHVGKPSSPLKKPGASKVDGVGHGEVLEQPVPTGRNPGCEAAGRSLSWTRRSGSSKKETQHPPTTAKAFSPEGASQTANGW